MLGRRVSGHVRLYVSLLHGPRFWLDILRRFSTEPALDGLNMFRFWTCAYLRVAFSVQETI